MLCFHIEWRNGIDVNTIRFCWFDFAIFANRWKRARHILKSAPMPFPMLVFFQLCFFVLSHFMKYNFRSTLCMDVPSWNFAKSTIRFWLAEFAQKHFSKSIVFGRRDCRENRRASHLLANSINASKCIQIACLCNVSNCVQKELLRVSASHHFVTHKYQQKRSRSSSQMTFAGQLSISRNFSKFSACHAHRALVAAITEFRAEGSHLKKFIIINTYNLIGFKSKTYTRSVPLQVHLFSGFVINCWIILARVHAIMLDATKLKHIRNLSSILAVIRGSDFNRNTNNHERIGPFHGSEHKE